MSPGAPLTVTGEVRQNNDSAFYSFYDSAGGTRNGYLQVTSSDSLFVQQNAAPMRFFTSNTERVRIDSAGNLGIGTTTPSSRLDVEGTIQIGDGGETCSIAANAGMIKYAAGALQYCNGSAWQTLGVSGAGLTSLNGQTSSTQTFAVSGSGTAPAINSASNIHTLSIPLASGVGVTSGTISKIDYDAFTAKLSAVSGSSLNSGLMWVGNGSNQAAAVSMSGDATLSNTGALTIANSAVTTAKINADAVTSAKILDGSVATVDIANSAVTDAKIATVSVNKITSALGQYFTYDPNGGACAIGEVLKKTVNGWECGTDSGGVTDHGLLGGLSDDDHTQYVMLAGRTGGQNLRGGTAANNNLTLESTSDATKGHVLLQPNGGNVGIGTTAPGSALNVSGTSGIAVGAALAGGNAYTPPAASVMLSGTNQAGLSTYSSPGNTTTLGLINYYADSADSFSRFFDIVAMGSTGGATSNIRFMTGAGTANERMRISGSGNVGIGTAAPTSRLDVEGTIQIGDGGETCSIAANAGMIKYAAGALQYCNGSSWQTLGVSGSGLTSLNGQTGSTQTFAINATGTAPAINSATNTHTISIPLASGTGVTSGTISKADYDAFTAKLSSVAGSSLSAGMLWVGNGSNQAAAVSMSGDATLSNTGALSLANNSITSAKINADAVTSAKILDGTIATADLANSSVTDAKISTVSVNKITSALGQYLTYAPNGGACANGEVLKWNTVSGGWVCGADNSGGAPSGAAGGDLSGTYPNPSVAAGAITTAKIADGNVTNAKIASGVDASKITSGTFGGRIGQATGGFIVASKDDITTRTDSGFYQTSSATTAEGWPTNSNGWYHLLTSTHNNDANYYSMQFAGDFGNSSDLFYRATGGSGTAAWNRVWTSGNLTNLNQLANGPGYLTSVNSSMVTTALGYTPVNRAGDTMTGALTTPNLTLSSSDPYITANTNDKHVVYAGGSGWTPTGAVMVQRGVSSGSNSGGTEFYAATSGSRAFSINGYNSFAYNGNNVWHAGNLTNLNQLTNGPGYITGITGGMVNSALGYTAANLAEVPSGNNGAAASDQTGDMNNLNQKSGFYLGNNPANGPFGTWTTWISAMGHYPGDRYGFQIAKNYWGDDFRVRGVTNNTWGSWLSLWHSGNFNPASYQTALGYTPVNRAGDTMTGALTVNSNVSANNVYTPGWFRVQGNGGLYWENHGGGWYMQDASWIRNYNNKPLYLAAPGTSFPMIVTRDNGSFGKVTRFETTGGGTQDGPQINFHKQNAKQWSLGIDPGGENGYSIFEDGTEAGYGTRRFRLWNGGGMQLLGGNIDMQSGDSGVNVSGNEFRVWTNNWGHRMTVNQNAHIWTSAYGWLHDQFVQNDSDTNWRIYSRNTASSLSWNHSAFEVRPPSGQDAGWATISYHRPGQSTYMIGHDGNGLCFGPSDNCYFRINQAGDLRDPSGNFHMDSNGGNSTYINWFDGTGGLRVGNGGQNYGNVWAAGYFYASDQRLKENIQEINDPIGTVLALHGVTFDWKADHTNDIGFIAQEVEKVLPEMVKSSTDETGREIKSVKYGNIVAVVVEAVKEMWDKLTKTEKRVDQVELRLKAMEEKIQALELENARLKEQNQNASLKKSQKTNRKPASR